jgi:hypothetical protein
VVSTGGFYLEIWPQGAEVLVDNEVKDKTNLFSNQILIQGLSPKKYSVLVEKDDYFPWQKTLEVGDNEITRVENITLIKKKIIFDDINKDINDFPSNSPSPEEIFFIKDNNLYPADLPAGQAGQKDLAIIENLLSYRIYNNEIYWLSDSGFLNRSTISGKEISILNKIAFPVKNAAYKIFIFPNSIFLKEGNDLYLLNPAKKTFEKFYSPINNIKLSPDGSKMVFFNDYEIFYSDSTDLSEKIFLHRFSEKISDCFWLNNNYLIFNTGNKIKISEIDTRDKINMVDLPDNILLADNTYFELKSPKISWDETNKKLYILDQNNLFLSEQITDRTNN